MRLIVTYILLLFITSSIGQTTRFENESVVIKIEKQDTVVNVYVENKGKNFLLIDSEALTFNMLCSANGETLSIGVGTDLSYFDYVGLNLSPLSPGQKIERQIVIPSCSDFKSVHLVYSFLMLNKIESKDNVIEEIDLTKILQSGEGVLLWGEIHNLN